MFTIDE